MASNLQEVQNSVNYTSCEINSLPDEIMCEIFFHLDLSTKLNIASLVCKKWLQIISNDSYLTGYIYLHSWKWRTGTINEAEHELDSLLQRFPKLKELYLESGFVLPIKFDNNPILEKVCIPFYDQPIIFMQGQHCVFKLKEEEAMQVTCPLKLKTINSTYVERIWMNPKQDEVKVENISLKHAENLIINLDFPLGPEMNSWQEQMTEKLIFGLEEFATEEILEHLEELSLTSSMILSDYAIRQFHRIISSLLRLKSKNLVLLDFDLNSKFLDDTNIPNQPIVLDPLPINKQIKCLKIQDRSDDWNCSKIVIKRLFDSLPELEAVSFTTYSAYHLQEIFGIIGCCQKLRLLELQVLWYPWRYCEDIVECNENFQAAIKTICDTFPIEAEVHLEQIWYDKEFEEIGSCIPITKMKGKLPKLNEFAFLPFNHEAFEEPDDILSLMDLPELFMQN